MKDLDLILPRDGVVGEGRLRAAYLLGVKAGHAKPSKSLVRRARKLEAALLAIIDRWDGKDTLPSCDLTTLTDAIEAARKLCP